MKTTASLIALFVVVAFLFRVEAKLLVSETPAAPPFSAAEAARVGDAYVAKTFPQFPTLYCSEVSYDSVGEACIRPDPTIVWRLRYLIPNNPAKEIAGSPFPDWGVCLVFVHADKTVTHTVAPKQNLK